MNKKNYIVGECKFTNSTFDLGKYNKLKEKFVEHNVYYYLFSLSGFSSSLIEMSKKTDKLVLVDIKEIFSV